MAIVVKNNKKYMFLLDEIFSSELRSRVALADVFLKLECLVQSKDDLEKKVIM